MSVLGNRWAFALLVAAFVGISRFTDFQMQLGAPPGSIADRLSIFVANGVLAVADNRYRLTEKGRALFPVLISALQWAQRWFRAPEGPAVDAHAHGVRSALHGRADLRPVHPAAARNTGLRRLALSGESANIAGAQ